MLTSVIRVFDVRLLLVAFLFSLSNFIEGAGFLFACISPTYVPM